MRLIDADALKLEYPKDEDWEYYPVNTNSEVCETIDEAPTVDAKPVRHGKWIYGEGKSGNDGYYCTNCHEHIKWNYKNESIDFIQKYNYCPYCGAKMDGERKEE